MINSLRKNIFQSKTLKLIQGILFLVFLTACKNKTEDINKLIGKISPQEDVAKGVVFVYSENAKVKARLFATEFIMNDVAKPPFWDARKGLKVEFYNDSTQIESTLTANFGRYYPNQQNVFIRDSVVVVNKKGEQLKTEELIWNQKLRKFYTEKFVRIKTPTQIIYGDGLEANEDFSWYQITNIKGVIQVNKSEVPQ